MRCLISAAVTLLFIPPALAADETFDQLPEDGAWAKYYVTVAGPTDPILTIELTLRSVGKLQENGKDCRWIELQSVNSANAARLNVFKLLISEEELKQGPFGPSDAIRAWAADMENTPQAADGTALAPLSFVFPDQLDDPQRPGETETIDWQRGQLDCPVLTGSSDSRLGMQDIEIEHRYLLAAEIPFGLGGFRSVINLGPNNQITIEARLLDTGSGAVSALPNSQ